MKMKRAPAVCLILALGALAAGWGVWRSWVSGPALLVALEAQDRLRVTLLLDLGARADVPDAQGWTALHWACYRSDEELARALIAARADVSAPGPWGMTALDYAAYERDRRLAAVLIASGADPHRPNPRMGGITALEIWPELADQ